MGPDLLLILLDFEKVFLFSHLHVLIVSFFSPSGDPLIFCES